VELREAVSRARPGTTILLQDGIYQLDRMLSIAVPGLVLRGQSGDRRRVVLRGRGMDESKVGVALSIDAPRVVIADLTVGAVGFHGVQIHGEHGVSDVVLHNILVIDTGQQLVKGSVGPDGRGADRGLVACSSFQYSDHAPSNYTNGVDILGGRGWTVRDNFFFQIRGPRQEGWSAGPAVLFWVGSEDTVVERNLVLDCFRGIALGLIPRKDRPDGIDHRGGVIRNNIVCNLNGWADEGIEANAAPAVRIDHNTVLVEGHVPWSISVRFPQTDAVVRNNLTHRPIILRDGARSEQEGNVTGARPDWFVDPDRGVLYPKRGDVAAIDAGVPLPDNLSDFDRIARPRGAAPDAGAFEYDPGSPRLRVEGR
jgi:hypothetical protein